MSERYDRAITVFSPDGHLFQVEYATEAVKKGNTVVGVRGQKAVVLAVQKSVVPKLQNPRTVRKILQLDENITTAFAGLNADARALIDRARIECQSHRLNVDETPKVEIIARYVARIQQRFTQSHGVRPFGVSLLIAGHDPDGTSKLFQCDPSGNYSEWKAVAIGRNDQTVREFLEKEYDAYKTEDAEAAPEEPSKAVVKMAVRALLQVVESAKSIEVAVLRPGEPLHIVPEEEVATLVTEINGPAAAASAPAPASGTGSGSGS